MHDDACWCSQLVGKLQHTVKADSIASRPVEVETVDPPDKHNDLNEDELCSKFYLSFVLAQRDERDASEHPNTYNA